jgi:hypothetical protein
MAIALTRALVLPLKDHNPIFLAAQESCGLQSANLQTSKPTWLPLGYAFMAAHKRNIACECAAWQSLTRLALFYLEHTYCLRKTLMILLGHQANAFLRYTKYALDRLLLLFFKPQCRLR